MIHKLLSAMKWENRGRHDQKRESRDEIERVQRQWRVEINGVMVLVESRRLVIELRSLCRIEGVSLQWYELCPYLVVVGSFLSFSNSDRL